MHGAPALTACTAHVRRPVSGLACDRDADGRWPPPGGGTDGAHAGDARGRRGHGRRQARGGGRTCATVTATAFTAEDAEDAEAATADFEGTTRPDLCSFSAGSASSAVNEFNRAVEVRPVLRPGAGSHRLATHPMGARHGGTEKEMRCP
jgi:hypothetical protein